MAVMAYSPVVRGMFARAVTDRNTLGEGDARRRQAWFEPANLEANLKLVAQVEELARSKGCSASRIALAWVLSRGQDIIPIPSSKSIAHIEDNLAAAELRLSAADLAALDEIFKPGAVQGERGASARATERAGMAKALH
jgi:aryl-alcohol dehydrogenase-like predicted oxidoreductase